MGALKGTATLRRYLVRGEAPKELARLVKGVRAHAFIPIDPHGEVERATGWAAIEDPQDLDLTSDKLHHGEALALALRIDTLRPPSAVVKRLVEQGLRALGRKPNRAEKRAYQQEVVRKLRTQYHPTMRSYDCVWVLEAGRVLFFSHGKGPNEALLELFKKSFGLDLQPEGPAQVARKAVGPLPASLPPTPEMTFGFPGLPGRPVDGDDADA